MEVRFKLLNDLAVLPKYAMPGDAGMDLTVVDVVKAENKLIVKFGLAVEIPEGYVGLLFPRSSVHKKELFLSNSVGVIDSGYRGELMAVFYSNVSHNEDIYKAKERAVQLIIMPYPKIEPVLVDDLSSTERGQGGYGSTN